MGRILPWLPNFLGFPTHKLRFSIRGGVSWMKIEKWSEKEIWSQWLTSTEIINGVKRKYDRSDIVSEEKEIISGMKGRIITKQWRKRKWWKDAHKRKEWIDVMLFLELELELELWLDKIYINTWCSKFIRHSLCKPQFCSSYHLNYSSQYIQSFLNNFILEKLAEIRTFERTQSLR